MDSTIISLLSGLGGMFGWGIYDFFAGVYAKKIGPFKTFFRSRGFGCVLVLLLALVFPFSLDILVLAARGVFFHFPCLA